MAAKHTVDYSVGYRKPPKHSRFQKGRSGNPRGRPKGTPNLASILMRILKEPVVVTEQGRRRTITKFEVAVTQLVNQAAKGEPRAMALVLNLIQYVEDRVETQAASTDPVSDADRQVMTRLLTRLTRMAKGENTNGNLDTDSPRL